jgi:hypothetical protein
MVDATISSGRLRDLAGLGRSRARDGRAAAVVGASAARRPRATSSRPEANDLVASTI